MDNPDIAQLAEQWTVDGAAIHGSLVRIRLSGFHIFLFESGCLEGVNTFFLFLKVEKCCSFFIQSSSFCIWQTQRSKEVGTIQRGENTTNNKAKMKMTWEMVCVRRVFWS
jgi:hypothetical protein